MVSLILQWKQLFVTVMGISVVFGLTNTTVMNTKSTKCDKSTRGLYRLFNARMGEEKVTICSQSNDVYQWKFIDGSLTLGEEFDPAKDCSDVVDNVPDAKDGFYWIELKKGKAQKVWCDVNTDSGGFMLIGKKNSPSLWKVPSNPKPVDPKGPPHWSSVFGDFKVQDFAVQISKNNTFEGTQAHWFYRLNQRRNLGNLFGVGKGGCTDFHSGIGDIAYVKDILTETVVTTKFNCTKFGPHVDPKVGWGRMNLCLKTSCLKGYAFFPGFPLRLDNFGSFSYSSNSPFSGITHESTAFVGCNNKKCCACYGPKGGRKNYCGPRCTSLNGGTVTKHAYVWFWIRTRMPQRVWKRCMEFKIKIDNGSTETYFIDRKTGSAHKGSCSSQFHTLLNEGTLTVSNKNNLENIPKVPGLVSYSEESKQLFVNNGSQWNALSSENEVKKLKARIDNLEERLRGKTIAGVVYTRWGRDVCPAGSTRVYSGIVGGSYYTQGGASNYLCLPLNPIYNKIRSGTQGSAYVYGSNFELQGTHIFPSGVSRDHNDVICAVCQATSRVSQMMIPARNVCPSGWTLEYKGYLMAQQYGQRRTEYICVDGNPKAWKGKHDKHGILLYFVEGKCGSLPCGPYVDGYELTCAVCTQ